MDLFQWESVPEGHNVKQVSEEEIARYTVRIQGGDLR